MHPDELRAAAAELEGQLAASTNLDEESRRSLERALQEIRTALQNQGQPTEERQSLVERLRFAVEKFEGTHPTLTGTMMRLIDGLTEMGI